MVRELLFWWLRQLRSMLPRVLQGDAGRAMPRLTLSPGLDGVAGAEPGRGMPVRFAALDPASLARLRNAHATPVELEVPAPCMLAQEITLPLAAERDLGGVLRFEMDRFTPFAAEDLHWSWQVLRRDRAASTVTLRLLLAPRAPLAGALAALGAAGLRLAALRAVAGRIPLGPAAGARQDGLVRNALLGLCAVLALGVVLLPFVRQSMAFAALDGRLDAVRPALREAEALRRSAQDEAAGMDVLAAQRSQSGSVLSMLAALTAGLGDGTYLTDLSYRARVATATGVSDAAVRLIPALTAEAALAKTSFTAPVTRIDAGGRQGFALRTELAP